MKVYEVIVSDYDLYGEYGLYREREDAERKLDRLKNDSYFVFRDKVKIVEKEIIEHKEAVWGSERGEKKALRRVSIKKVVASSRRGIGKKVVSEQLIIYGRAPLVREIVSNRGKTR